MFCMPELSTHQLFPAPQSMLTDCYCFVSSAAAAAAHLTSHQPLCRLLSKLTGKAGKNPLDKNRGAALQLAGLAKLCLRRSLTQVTPLSNHRLRLLQSLTARVLCSVQFEADVLMFPRSCGSCCAWLAGAGLNCPQCGVAAWCGDTCRQADTTHSLSCSGLATNRSAGIHK